MFTMRCIQACEYGRIKYEPGDELTFGDELREVIKHDVILRTCFKHKEEVNPEVLKPTTVNYTPPLPDMLAKAEAEEKARKEAEEGPKLEEITEVQDSDAHPKLEEEKTMPYTKKKKKGKK